MLPYILKVELFYFDVCEVVQLSNSLMFILFFTLVFVTFIEVQNTVNTLIRLYCHLILTDNIGYVAVVAVTAVDRGEGGGITKVG